MKMMLEFDELAVYIQRMSIVAEMFDDESLLFHTDDCVPSEVPEGPQEAGRYAVSYL